MSQWKPIETAPKYDIEFLAYRKNSAYCIAVVSEFYGICETTEYRRIEPTHWMPLPPPPEAQR